MGISDQIAVCADQSPPVGAGGSSRHLLPQNCPDGKLGWVHCPWDTPARVARDELCHRWILGQNGVDSLGIGVKVKHPSAPTDGAGEVALVGE
jgi:hypothetical protein